MRRNLILPLLFCVLSAPALPAQPAPAPETLPVPRETLIQVESRGGFSGPPAERWAADAKGAGSVSFAPSVIRPGPLQQPEGSERTGYRRGARRLALVQGGYYTATGLWPILHMRSFEQVTGPKTDDWLVKTVGSLIAVVGGTLLGSGIRDAPSRDLGTVALGSAAALTAVDVVYVAKGRISRIYLLDAAIETALIAGWAVTLGR